MSDSLRKHRQADALELIALSISDDIYEWEGSEEFPLELARRLVRKIVSHVSFPEAQVKIVQSRE